MTRSFLARYTGISSSLFVALAIMSYVLLMDFGRSQLAKATSAPLANGVVALLLATVLGVFVAVS